MAQFIQEVFIKDQSKISRRMPYFPLKNAFPKALIELFPTGTISKPLHMRRYNLYSDCYTL